MPDYLKLNKGIYFYYRRVPERYRRYVDKDVVWKTTERKADDRANARKIAIKINDETEALWRALEAGGGEDDVQAYEAAIVLARDFGFQYKSAEAIAAGSLGDILERLTRLEAQRLTGSAVAVSAVMGGRKAPEIRLSNLFETYHNLEKTALTGKSDNQFRKWSNQRKNAIQNLKNITGDKLLVEILQDDLLEFRTWWADRVIHEGLTRGAANKNISQLNKMFREVNQKYKLGMTASFSEMRLRGVDESRRVAYDSAFVQDNILADGALDDLNEEARAAVYIVAATGMRPSEVVNLDEDKHIHLCAPIPFVEIRPLGRDIKSRNARRDIPLVGLALLAMKLVPKGFPRYRNREDTLSNTVNKALKLAGLRPTIEHSFYSLRHTFNDLLTAKEAPTRIEKDLMGHALDGPRYGSGPSLEQKAEWLEKIAYEPPASLLARSGN